jgi:hypothetical protein
LKWQDHNPEVEVLVKNADRWINVVRQMVGVGNGWPGGSLVMNPNQELWKAQEPLS